MRHKTQPVPNDPDIWAMQTWEKSNVLGLIADDQELITANFITTEVRAMCDYYCLSKKQKMTSSY